jgi:hypothetical protein
VIGQVSFIIFYFEQNLININLRFCGNGPSDFTTAAQFSITRVSNGAEGRPYDINLVMLINVCEVYSASSSPM